LTRTLAPGILSLARLSMPVRISADGKDEPRLRRPAAPALLHPADRLAICAFIGLTGRGLAMICMRSDVTAAS
jgi:hypothetical protein